MPREASVSFLRNATTGELLQNVALAPPPRKSPSINTYPGSEEGLPFTTPLSRLAEVSLPSPRDGASWEDVVDGNVFGRSPTDGARQATLILLSTLHRLWRIEDRRCSLIRATQTSVGHHEVTSRGWLQFSSFIAVSVTRLWLALTVPRLSKPRRL